MKLATTNQKNQWTPHFPRGIPRRIPQSPRVTMAAYNTRG